MEIEKFSTGLIPTSQQNWQGRPEWFFNREHTDSYEQWYEGRYKRAEIWQKKVMEQLVSNDRRQFVLKPSKLHFFELNILDLNTSKNTH